MIKQWFRSGTPWIWLNGAAVAINLILVFGLLAMIFFRGMGYFWPKDVMQADYHPTPEENIRLIGEIHDVAQIGGRRLQDSGVPVENADAEYVRYLMKTGNRDSLGLDFRLVLQSHLDNVSYPEDIMTLERREWGNFYGRLIDVRDNGTVIASGAEAREAMDKHLDETQAIYDEIHQIEKVEIGEINYGLERIRLKRRGMELDGNTTPEALDELTQEEQSLHKRYNKLQQDLAELYHKFDRYHITAEIMDGRQVNLPLSSVVRVYYANEMGWFGKTGMYLAKLWEFVSDEPREANTEGGVFPAIFGTVLMVLLMAVIVTPFGVVAAVYLHEYAKQGFVTRVIRIAVNNLAGVPSIVYGVFGLGFFVYFLGGNIDSLFFPEAKPSPTFGTPGLLWSSLTLALLTLPVVIVATEEGLSRVPRALREGSLALGATHFETIWRIILPTASPAMMTGLILAVARAAGEVAPLMLVGVVKLAPSLPLDGNFPFFHPDRKFMHLGFHIYDVGFQSPNVEAARPLVYATALLLVLVIVVLNLLAIRIRNRLREKYRAMES